MMENIAYLLLEIRVCKLVILTNLYTWFLHERFVYLKMLRVN